MQASALAGQGLLACRPAAPAALGLAGGSAAVIVADASFASNRASPP